MQDRLIQMFFGLVIVYMIWKVWQKMTSNLVMVRSRIDSKEYLVQNLPDKEDAADLLAKLMSSAWKVVDKAKTSSDEDLKRLAERFNPKSVQENVQNSSYTSYSENKGEKIVLCLRKKDSSFALLDEQVILFVFLHELAHLATKESGPNGGHTKVFWSNFKKIITIAHELGVYQPIDYSKNPEQYCGIDITDNVYFTTV